MVRGGPAAGSQSRFRQMVAEVEARSLNPYRSVASQELYNLDYAVYTAATRSGASAHTMLEIV